MEPEERATRTHDDPESRARTLILFGIGLMVVIASIIAVAAIIGA